MLFNDIKAELIKDIQSDDENKTRIKTETLIHFKKEADELGTFIDYTEHFEDSKRSLDFFVPDNDNISALYYFLDEKIESLYIKYENDALTIQ